MDHWRRTVIEAGMEPHAFYDMTPGQLCALAIIARDRREQDILDLSRLAIMVKRTIGALWTPDRSLTEYSLAGLPAPRKAEQTPEDWARMLAAVSTKVAH